MGTIYKIKAGDLGAGVQAEMAAYAAELIADGAEAVIAGCTEAPLVLSAKDVKAPFLDAGELLARRCVAVCLGQEPVPTLPGG
jgi:aspartate racemase